MGRGRPPKSDGERKAKDLRIPVTDYQKRLIAEAMQLSGQDMASWARPLLVEAAEAIISARKKSGKKDATPRANRALPDSSS